MTKTIIRNILAGCLALLTLSTISFAQAKQDLPIVKSGDFPLYPSMARAARISGEVMLRVTTDGEGVASVAVESGHFMLSKAAQENVKTWKFLKHEPTVFSTRFLYLLDEKSTCEADKKANDGIVLKLPSEVQVSALIADREYCDPNAGLDMSEPLRVFLTRCEIDGSTVPCEKVNLRLHSKGLNASPVRFTESKDEQGFVIPKEFRSIKSFGLTIETEKGTVTVEEIDGSFLKGKWRVGIDHKPFKESTGLYGLSKKLECIGYVHFQWSEPERMVWSSCK